MKENKDRHQIVIAREMYDDLIRLADIGAHERDGHNGVVRTVRRHAQKYNKHLHEERQVEVVKDAAEYRRLRSEVIDLVVNHIGQIVWVKSKSPAPRGLEEGVTFYIAYEVVGRSELSKLAVKVAPKVGSGLSDKHISALRKDLPEGYTYTTVGMGSYTAYDPKVVELRKPYQITRGK